jgi:hypothetical protein
MAVLSIIGAILSGIGCWCAWVQARRAKQAREAIEVDRKRAAVIESTALAKRAREEAARLQKRFANSVRGMDLQAVVDKIKDCLQYIGDCIHRVDDDEVASILADSDRMIMGYPTMKMEDRYAMADSIYDNMSKLVRRLEVLKDNSI